MEQLFPYQQCHELCKNLKFLTKMQNLNITMFRVFQPEEVFFKDIWIRPIQVEMLLLKFVSRLRTSAHFTYYVQYCWSSSLAQQGSRCPAPSPYYSLCKNLWFYLVTTDQSLTCSKCSTLSTLGSRRASGNAPRGSCDRSCDQLVGSCDLNTASRSSGNNPLSTSFTLTMCSQWADGRPFTRQLAMAPWTICLAFSWV